MSSVRSSLDTLSKTDVQSLLMFVLFKIDKIPELAVLSQLIYLLDENSLIKLLKYFGGQTITFPTVEELRVLIHTLALYKRTEIDGENFEACVEEIPKSLQDTVVKQFYNVNSS